MIVLLITLLVLLILPSVCYCIAWQFGFIPQRKREDNLSLEKIANFSEGSKHNIEMENYLIPFTYCAEKYLAIFSDGREMSIEAARDMPRSEALIMAMPQGKSLKPSLFALCEDNNNNNWTRVLYEYFEKNNKENENL